MLIDDGGDVFEQAGQRIGKVKRRGLYKGMGEQKTDDMLTSLTGAQLEFFCTPRLDDIAHES